MIINNNGPSMCEQYHWQSKSPSQFAYIITICLNHHNLLKSSQFAYIITICLHHHNLVTLSQSNDFEITNFVKIKNSLWWFWITNLWVITMAVWEEKSVEWFLNHQFCED